MKYIRTESEICELDDNWALFCQEYANNKQADTIEELCDEIVIKNRNSKKPYLLEDWQKQELFKQKVKPDYITEIYGAIWTDKGVIFVAKMNKEGELELI